MDPVKWLGSKWRCLMVCLLIYMFVIVPCQRSEAKPTKSIIWIQRNFRSTGNTCMYCFGEGLILFEGNGSYFTITLKGDLVLGCWGVPYFSLKLLTEPSFVSSSLLARQ